MLRIDFNLVLTMINLVILFLILRKFLFRPIMNIMEKREAMISDGLKNAEDSQNQALELKSQYEEKLKGAGEESSQMIERARQEARQSMTVSCRMRGQRPTADEECQRDRGYRTGTGIKRYEITGRISCNGSCKKGPDG